MYKIMFTKLAIKDNEKLKEVGLSEIVRKLIELIKNNPFQTPPPYEKLVGDLVGLYSRRINIKHRLVYEMIKKEKIIKVIRMWTHYEK
ncbi:MAG: Txe/YoeB family addiction module toxin [Candidatus Izemoplasmatales bacterium]|nr:Txe/YoeB family addiction module toxin [Candidatus Izemoplasmatales bacterium]